MWLVGYAVLYGSVTPRKRVSLDHCSVKSTVYTADVGLEALQTSSLGDEDARSSALSGKKPKLSHYHCNLPLLVVKCEGKKE